MRGVMHDLHGVRPGNIDYWRFEASATNRLKQLMKDKFLLLAARAGFVRKNFPAEDVADRLLRVIQDLDELDHFYHLLHNETSRQLLVDLLKFRVLGNRYASLPINNERYRQTRAGVTKFLKQRNTFRAGPLVLNHYALDQAHGSIQVQTHPTGILDNFLLEQYAYNKIENPIRAQAGDTVIDAGGCWGETALYFANAVGPSGKVYSFEFVPDNLALLRKNFGFNRDLARIITTIEKPVWNKSGEVLRFWLNGPGTSCVLPKDKDTLDAVSVSVDDVVKDQGIERVDFIKMDIEGAELPALQGAERTIRSFRPKLAISVYHKDDDFIRIPDYLDKLGVQYEFFLEHFTIHGEETVLFARSAN